MHGFTISTLMLIGCCNCIEYIFNEKFYLYSKNGISRFKQISFILTYSKNWKIDVYMLLVRKIWKKILLDFEELSFYIFFSSASLRSRSSFFLVCPKNGALYVWHGSKSLEHVRDRANHAAENFRQKYDCIHFFFVIFCEARCCLRLADYNKIRLRMKHLLLK